LSQNKPFDELLQRTPDEFDAFIRRTAQELNDRYRSLDYRHVSFISDKMLLTSHFSTRKEQAAVILSAKDYNTKILFDMLDGKDYSRVIWSMIRPKWSKPFMNVDES
jgi:RNA ligase